MDSSSYDNTSSSWGPPPAASHSEAPYLASPGIHDEESPISRIGNVIADAPKIAFEVQQQQSLVRVYTSPLLALVGAVATYFVYTHTKNYAFVLASIVATIVITVVSTLFAYIEYKQYKKIAASDNIPLELEKWKQLNGLLAAPYLLLGAFAVAGYVYYRSGEPVLAISIAGAGVAITALVGGFSYLFYRRLSQTHTPTDKAQFKTSTAVEYRTAFDKAILAADERVYEWLGPITRHGKGSYSYEFLAKEVNKIPENTLLFTQHQVIAVMCVPEDDLGQDQSQFQDTMHDIAQNLANYSSDDSGDKNIQFSSINSGRWEQIVRGLGRQSLDAALASHIHYGIPYSNIASFEVREKFFNAGIWFTLTNGDVLKFATLNKTRTPHVAQFLQQYIR